MVSDICSLLFDREGVDMVLILVLMEYGLGRSHRGVGRGLSSLVLILVLMEYGLGRDLRGVEGRNLLCLNPCFNGIWSRTEEATDLWAEYDEVLILVLMEYGLGGVNGLPLHKIKFVLILVLMEYGLGPSASNVIFTITKRLNPCFNGIWSRTLKTMRVINTIFAVLILVLMEYGLGDRGRLLLRHPCPSS